jgi:amino-acid N-acetyltransferase
MLLSGAALPVDGADEAFEQGVVAVADGVVVGAAAIERYGSDGLLRSVVVDPGLRSTGVGRALVASAEALASGLGIRDLYLLTETAVEWFPRLGYAVLDRATAPDGIAGSWEFRFACVERGVLMRRSLGG